MTDNLGPYQLRGELGRGAMAIVWRGWDANLEREVAIKEPVIPATADEAARADLSARFVREGKAAAQLNHPGIVTIHAADVFDGRPAIVMELIEGETLCSVLDRGALPAPAAIGILDQLLDAVAYAHDRGVVHRDIKPDNVFITTDGRVKLADFGIAHVGSSATLTQAGTVMGTPGYMAPEQVTGDAIDGRADIFAVGSIGYEMLSGHNPFGATDGIAPTTVMYRIVHEAPPSIPEGALAGLPVALSPVIGTALAKDPADRFADARAFRAALAGGPIVTGRMAGVPGAVTAAPAPATGWGSQAAAATVVGQAGSGTNWTPYLIFGAFALVALVALIMFSGGGASGGGGRLPGSVQSTATASGTTPPPSGGSAAPPAIPPHDIKGTTAVASTELPPSGTSTYFATNVLDGDERTAWEEGDGPNSPGIGQWIEVTLPETSVLTVVRVIPGYQKYANGIDRFWTNSRVKRATFTFSDGSNFSYMFDDKKGWQTVTLPTPVKTDTVRMTIESAYAPHKSAAAAWDTSVSEMKFSGWTAAEMPGK